MNTKKYMQTDSRWSQLGYPKKPCTIGNSGCGEVSICNCIIEMKQYENYTPATIQPYCKQFAASNCDGTYWSGIPKMMKHYGLTEVKEHQTMDTLWKELAKGDRVAIYLMGSRPGGSKKVHWTSGGHFICSVDYRYKDNDHQVYVKDSYSNATNRNGWCGYKTHLKGDVSAVWSGKLNGAKPSPQPTPQPTPTPTPTGKLTVDGIGGTATVKRMQQFFGTTQDGYIGGQLTKFKTLYPSLTAVKFGKGGSQCVIKLQKWLGLSDPDGIIGKNTTKAWQKKLRTLGYLAKNESIDGIFGVKSMKAWQECLNNDGKPKGNPSPSPTPTPTPTPTKSQQDKMCEWAKKIANSGEYKYKRWKSGDKKTQECPICKNLKGKYKGWNCIGFAWASWHHSGLNTTCNCGVISNDTAEKILKAKTDADAKKIAQKYIGTSDIKVIRNKSGIAASSLKKGDVVLYFKGNTYFHTVLYVGNSKVAESNTTNPNITYGKVSYHKSYGKVAIRYTK